MKIRNKMATALMAALTVTLVLVIGSLRAADSRAKREAAQTFMRLKLVWSQAVLEGLTLEKFDQVSQNAIRMRNMTASSSWYTVRQPDYMAHTTNFQKSVDALYLAAVDKKLDAATEAYVNVTRRCVECHRMVRVEQRKNAGLPTTTSDSGLKLRPEAIP